MMNKEQYDNLYYRAAFRESGYWSLLMHVKYTTGSTKFIFDDEKSARDAYEGMAEALKKDKNYSNERERTFTFTSYGNSSTTVDISDISYISVNAPTKHLFEDEEIENA